MNDLISILKGAGANVKLEVSGEDLLEFSNELIKPTAYKVTFISK